MPARRHRLAQRRKAVGLSQEQLAEIIGVDRVTVGRWERAESEPQPWHRPHLARALNVSVEELAALLADVGEALPSTGRSAPFVAADQVQPAPHAVPSQVMRRRALLAFGATVAGPGALLPSLALEAARHSLALVAAEELVAISVDEWWEIVNDHGHSYLSTPPAELLSRLAVDAVGLQHAMFLHQDDEPVLNELRRIGATLAALTALTLSNLDRFVEARRWWRSARQIAHGSADVQTVVWVRGHEVVRSLYEGRSPAVVMRLAEEGSAYSVHAQLTARPRLIAGRAQALGMLGQAREAERALNDLRDTYSALPVEATRDDKPLINTPESRLRFTESFVYAYLGDTTKAELAQRQARALYPASYPHGPVEIDLMQALCQVRTGDITGGIHQAHTVMANLTHAHRIRPVVSLGHKVLEAVPLVHQRQPGVADFRALLATPA